MDCVVGNQCDGSTPEDGIGHSNDHESYQADEEDTEDDESDEGDNASGEGGGHDDEEIPAVVKTVAGRSAMKRAATSQDVASALKAPPKKRERRPKAVVEQASQTDPPCLLSGRDSHAPKIDDGPQEFTTASAAVPKKRGRPSKAAMKQVRVHNLMPQIRQIANALQSVAFSQKVAGPSQPSPKKRGRPAKAAMQQASSNILLPRPYMSVLPKELMTLCSSPW
jgi:hypothetical protein